MYVPHHPPDLKILIVSTPKTGNTWLKYLLAAMYHLPLVVPQLPFVEAEFENFGPRWVGHQHFWPTPQVVQWARHNHIRLLTTIRHPADVLLSLYHFVHTPQGQTFDPGGALLLADTDGVGSNTCSYVEKFFFSEIQRGLSWVYSGLSQIVRYEKLWQNPVETLATLTTQLAPVPLEDIERAVEQSAIDLLRRQHNAKGWGRFFRQGGSSDWQAALPATIREALRRPPYPAQFEALGYSLDRASQLELTPRVWPNVYNPFREVTHFDNGVPVPAVAIRMYLSFEVMVARQRWPEVAETSAPDSFFSWLNAPADSDPLRLDPTAPLISNLILRLYHDHFNLVAEFPDVYHTHRVAWLLWFLEKAHSEFDLDDAFIAPVLASLVTWASAQAAETASSDLDLPPLTNFALHLYLQRADVRVAFPDLNSLYRVDYLLWVLHQAPKETTLPLALLKPIHLVFLRWANTPDPQDTDCPPGLPRLSRWAAHAYRKSAEYRAEFPDVYGADRLSFLNVFFSERVWFAEALQFLAETWAKALPARVVVEKTIHE